MTPIALKLCHEHDVSFHETFRYQYVISDKNLGLPGFRDQPIGSVVLQTGDALKCEALQDTNGLQFGFVIGVAAAHDGRSPCEFLCDNFDCTAKDAVSDFENRLTFLSGRFGVVVIFRKKTRFYTDACGMISAVYHPGNRIAAASVGLCIDKSPVPAPLFNDLETGKPAGTFGLCHTQDAEVLRLNPNHFLDLDSFETSRFWPRADDTFHLEPDQYAGAIDEIIDASRNIVRRHVMDNKTSLPLTGGFDSRSILAVADTDTLHEIDQIYTHILTWINICDAAIANQLCQLKGLGLEVHNAFRKRKFSGRIPVSTIQAQFRIASSSFEGPHRMLENRAVIKVMRDAVVLRGQQMPILRGLFIEDTNEDAWTADYITQRFIELLHLDHADTEMRKDIGNYVTQLYDELPQPARRRALDLLLVEAVNGPDLSSWYCGVSHSFYSSPYNSRRLIQLFASFETAFRRSGLAMDMLLLRADPVTKTVAMTPKVKTVKVAEEDISVAQRQKRLNRSKRVFKNTFGTASDNLPMIRYRNDGTVEYLPL